MTQLPLDYWILFCGYSDWITRTLLVDLTAPGKTLDSMGVNHIRTKDRYRHSHKKTDMNCTCDSKTLTASHSKLKLLCCQILLLSSLKVWILHCRRIYFTFRFFQDWDLPHAKHGKCMYSYLSYCFNENTSNTAGNFQCSLAFHKVRSSCVRKQAHYNEL